MFVGPVQQAMEGRLLAEFAPARLEVINESHMHKGPPNRETHFKVVIVADAFEGANRLQRHRLVNAALREQLEAGVHALAIHAWTLPQWEERGGEIPDSPLCRGG